MPRISLPAMHFAPEDYAGQLKLKSQRLQALLNPFGCPALEIHASPKIGFRMRAEFRLWHERSTGSKTDKRCYFAMFDPAEPKQPIEITEYPIACSTISQCMAPLLEAINASAVLARKLFQVEFLASRSNELLVTLVYHRQLDENWQAEATLLANKLNASIIGRARKQRIVLQRDHVYETLAVQGQAFRYEQCENSFTQPNASINEAMINWAVTHARGIDSVEIRDLLEMYCGNGNFSLPLARVFRQVLGTEISKTSIASAKRNAQYNRVKNISFVRLSGEETATALRGEREFRRLADISLADYDFCTVLVDPPRAGLDSKTLEFIAGFDNIIYISCNPQSLAENMSLLGKSHRITSGALFDQFPYTDHCEAGVFLARRAQ